MCIRLLLQQRFPAMLQEMEGELQQYHSRTKALELAVSDLRMQQSALRKDAARHLQGLKAAQAAIRWRGCFAYPAYEC